MFVKCNVPKLMAFGHRDFRELENIVYVDIENSVVRNEVIDSQSVLFDKIFAVDPVSGLPDGDIAVFMSENTSPEIKAFIQSQLMSPNVRQSDTRFDGLSDDELAALSRGAEESLGAYADRMRSVIYQQVMVDKSMQSRSE